MLAVRCKLTGVPDVGVAGCETCAASWRCPQKALTSTAVTFTGVWGRHSSAPSADSSTLPSVSDEDLQAQAWLPTVMSALLCHADKASASLAELESGRLPSTPACMRNTW